MLSSALHQIDGLVLRTKHLHHGGRAGARRMPLEPLLVLACVGQPIASFRGSEVERRCLHGPCLQHRPLRLQRLPCRARHFCSVVWWVWCVGWVRCIFSHPVHQKKSQMLLGALCRHVLCVGTDSAAQAVRIPGLVHFYSAFYSVPRPAAAKSTE